MRTIHRYVPLCLCAFVPLTACEREPDSPPSQAGRTLGEYQAEQTAQPSTPRDLRRFGDAEPKARTEGAIRLATYNVENLFDDVDDPDLSGRFEDIDDTKPESELIALADMIRRLDADILALQEIESESALNAFIEAHIPGLYPHVVSIDAGDERGIEQAVLSRFAITHTENWIQLPLGGVHPNDYGDQENWYAGEPITFHRSPLRVDVEIPPTEARPDPYTLTLFVVHQKSGRFSEYWRVAETAQLVAIAGGLLEEDPKSNIAVLGDFNAMADQPPMRAFADAGYFDPFADASGASSTTHESGRRIDAILLSPPLVNEFVPDSAFVLGAPARRAGADWRTTPPPPGYASDHYPVAIDLTPVD